jgi:16S rRNA (cytosine1402-N4)-methyltransferase
LSSDPPEAAPSPGHQPVLLAEVLEHLAPRPGEVAVDATLGRGGHAIELLRAIRGGVAPGLAASSAHSGLLIGIDRDRENLAAAGARLAVEAGLAAIPIEPAIAPRNEPAPGSIANASPVRLVHADFAQIDEVLASRGLAADLVLADLGASSPHFDDPERGFSFRHEGPLDMRLDRSGGVTAADLVAQLPERDLAETIRRLGEEPFAARIARKIARVRAAAPISTTTQLADLVRDAYGPRARHSRMHPATRTFMALRIAVNDELGSLQRLLARIGMAARLAAANEGGWLRRGARIGVIAFHSLEDRMVKHAFAQCEAEGLLRRRPRRSILPSEVEIGHNPRARSARLRVAMVGGLP